MKLPLEFQPTKEPLLQGQIVGVFMGRGCIGGIVIEPSKRKSRVRFPDSTEDWVDNKRLIVIKNKKWVAEISRRLQK